MKVRARVKAREDLPEWVQCCSGAVAEVQELGECIIDLGDQISHPETECRYCGKLNTFKDYGMAARIIGATKHPYVPLNLVDLDEGLMETV